MLVGEPGLELAYHFLHDALGSIVGVVSNSGVLAERTTYDPYGKPYVESYDPQSGTWNAQPTSTTANPFGFTGHRYAAAVSRSPPIAIRAPAVRRDRPCRGLQESRRC
jgi:hypothetical protein